MHKCITHVLSAMTFVKHAIPLLLLTLLIPAGLVYADSERYTYEEIAHSFHVME